MIKKKLATGIALISIVTLFSQVSATTLDNTTATVSTSSVIEESQPETTSSSSAESTSTSEESITTSSSSEQVDQSENTKENTESETNPPASDNKEKESVETPTPTPTPKPAETPKPTATPTPTPKPEEVTNSENGTEEVLTDDVEQVQQAEQTSQRRTSGQQSNYTRAVQELEHVEPIELDWRMYKIDRVVSLAKEDLFILEEKDETSTQVGKLAVNGQVWELSDEGDWLYVESGKVRGFVKKDLLYRGEESVKKLEEIKSSLFDSLSEEYGAEIAEEFKDKLMPEVAEILIPCEENKAINYLNCTTYDIISNDIRYINSNDIEITDGITKDTIEVRMLNEVIEEEEIEEIPVIGLASLGNKVCVLEETEDGWCFIESDKVRGFVRSEYLSSKEEVLEKINEDKEDKIEELEESFVDCKVDKPEETKTFWYSIKSVKEGTSDSKLRKEILDFALQFVGNRYVWGGNDPHTGADCSGFVKYVYNHFGITLPRIADDQAYVGKRIPLSEASPGDLIFFSRGGYVYHVAMYAGNGKTVEAHSSAVGIVHMKRDMSNVCWATRLL